VRGAVDYILFFTGDVDVTPNANEISDWKYVDKAELQAMFDESGACALFCSRPSAGAGAGRPWRQLTSLQATRSRRGSS
jgi:isopentenyldiphosphate isomerase